MTVFYSAREAAEAAGVTYRMVDYWARTGVVRPTFAAHGSGSRRRYSHDDITALRIVQALRELACPLEVAAEVAFRVRGLPVADRWNVVGAYPRTGSLIFVGDDRPPVFYGLDASVLADRPVVLEGAVSVSPAWLTPMRSGDGVLTSMR